MRPPGWHRSCGAPLFALTMVTIKRVQLWRTEIRNKPGVLAAALEPLAHACVDLRVVMKHSVQGRSTRAAVEVLAGSGRRAVRAATAAGFTLSPTPVLLAEGDNYPGLAYAVTGAIAWAGIAVKFVSMQVVGDRYSAILGFQTDGDARKASSLIRKVSTEASRSGS